MTYHDAEIVVATLEVLGHTAEVTGTFDPDGWHVVLTCGCDRGEGGRCRR